MCSSWYNNWVTKCIVAFTLQQLLHERVTVLRYSALPVFLHVIYITDSTYLQCSKSSTQLDSDKHKLVRWCVFVIGMLCCKEINTQTLKYNSAGIFCTVSVICATQYIPYTQIHRYRVQLVLMPILISTSKDTDVYHILLLELYRR